MDFIADENIDSIIVEILRSNGHQVRYIAEVERGVNDDHVFQNANDSHAVLVTADKDFGEIVLAVVQEHKDELKDNFTVITPGVARIRRSIP